MLHHIGRLNVLVVVTDQQRADAVGYENKLVKTPYLDVLAAQSVVCNATYVQSPQCQPSRASIFTGRYPTAHKVWWNGVKIPESELTLGNYLRDAGYSTGYFGKLHFDGWYDHTGVAKHFGFDKSFLYEDWTASFGLGFKTARQTTVEKEFYGPMSTKTWTGRLSSPELHHEEIVTNKAISFIESTNRPFLCVVGFHGPHPPYAAPDIYSKLYDPSKMSVPTKESNLSRDEWRALKVQYYGSVSWIDACVGRLLDVVGHDTLVIFTSDHGDILGDHGLFSKGMFAYEGNVRVPLIMRLPQVMPCSYPYLVQSIDILPTVLEACEIKIPIAVQGKSLFGAVQTGEVVNQSVLSMIGHKPRLRMVRTPHHKYWVCGEEEVVFDLVKDPLELNRNAHRDHLAQLRLLLLQSLIRSEDPLPVPA